MHIQGGLAVDRLSQLLLRAFEHQLAQRTANGSVGAANQIGNDGILFSEVLAHAYGLCALAGKEECDAFAHRISLCGSIFPRGNSTLRGSKWYQE